MHQSAWKTNSPKFVSPRSYTKRCSYVQDRGVSFPALHKKTTNTSGKKSYDSAVGQEAYRTGAQRYVLGSSAMVASLAKMCHLADAPFQAGAYACRRYVAGVAFLFFRRPARKGKRHDKETDALPTG